MKKQKMAEKVDIFFLVFDFEETRKITKTHTNSNTQRHIFAMTNIFVFCFFFLSSVRSDESDESD